MEIRNAKLSDENNLRLLWGDCFGDKKEYLDLYFKNRFKPELTKLLLLEDQLIGMIHLLPCSIFPGQPAYYWYAVGIAKEFRGKGYFRFFCDKVLKDNRDRGIFNVCKPIKGLEGLYQKLGFAYPYYQKSKTYFADREEIDIQIEPALAENFLNLDLTVGSTDWGLNAVRYALLENEFCNGKSVRFYYNGKEYLGMAINSDSGWILDHTNVTEEIAQKVKNSILKYLETDRFTLMITEQVKPNADHIVGLSDSPLVGPGSKLTFSMY